MSNMDWQADLDQLAKALPLLPIIYVDKNQNSWYSIDSKDVGVAELADALDLGSSAVRCAGSIPVSRTNKIAGVT